VYKSLGCEKGLKIDEETGFIDEETGFTVAIYNTVTITINGSWQLLPKKHEDFMINY
jgi:hypothetical protein